MRRPILQRFQATSLVLIVPTVKRRSWHPDLFQRFARRQARLLDHPNNLEFFTGGVSHASSPPSAIMLFLSSRISSACSATTSFNALDSRRKSFTSSLVAARAVSPASRRLPASRNSFDQTYYIDWAIPSRRHNSAMLCSPRRPSITMRILSSAEKCRRVARRMSLSTHSAGTSELMGFGLIFVPPSLR